MGAISLTLADFHSDSEAYVGTVPILDETYTNVQPIKQSFEKIIFCLEMTHFSELEIIYFRNFHTDAKICENLEC